MGRARIIRLQQVEGSDWTAIGERLRRLALALPPSAGLEALQLMRVDDRDAVLIITAVGGDALSPLACALIEPLQLGGDGEWGGIADGALEGEVVLAMSGIDRFAGVDALDDDERCAYFVRHVVDAGEAWGLYGETWARSPAAGETETLPLWPQRELAARCIAGPWRACVPRPIALAALCEQWLTGMDEDGILAALIPGPAHHGTVVAAAVLAGTLRAALGGD